MIRRECYFYAHRLAWVMLENRKARRVAEDLMVCGDDEEEVFGHSFHDVGFVSSLAA